MLPLLVALPAALAPLLRGCWDLREQALIHAAVVAGLTLWLLFRTSVGYLPLPSSRNLAWTGALLCLGSASAWAAPAHAVSFPAWYVFVQALWLFPAMAALSKDERFYTDEAIRAAAWILMALAMYQRLFLGEPSPASALGRPEVYAGAILLLFPLAVEKRDWLLAAGLLLNLLWTRSAGAWLGLFGAMLLTGGRRAPWSWLGLTGALVCAAIIYDKFESPAVLDRWSWWKAAWDMAWDKPLLGHGPGSTAYLLPAFLPAGARSSPHAHQYYLQTAAEYGFPFALAWFGGLWHCLLKSRSLKRFGAVAILLYSFGDWALSMPSNLWMFAYFASSPISEGPRGVNVPSRYRLPACLAALALGWSLGTRAWALRERALPTEAVLSAPRPALP